MKRFTSAVEQAIEHKKWYAALSLALTLPDICGRLEQPNASPGARYRDWWNRYLVGIYTAYIGPDREKHVFLESGDAYALRCSLLHEGADDISRQRARKALDRFHFSTPKPGSLIHMNKVNSVLQLQVDVFCANICAGVEAWHADMEDNPAVGERMTDSLLVIYDSTYGIRF